MSAEQTFFSVAVNPAVRDVAAVIALAAPTPLTSVTFFSRTSLVLNFGPLPPGASAVTVGAAGRPLHPPHK
jgi:hypothetical protein